MERRSYGQTPACSWEILHECNYRCPYCPFLPSWLAEPARSSGSRPARTPDDWISFWRRIFENHGSFFIEVSGGEPFLYPDFPKLITEICRWHTVRIVTNCSWNPDDLPQGLPVQRVCFFGSLHPYAARLDEFVAKAAAMKSRGFRFHAVVVAYPPLLDRLPIFRDTFQKHAITWSLIPFQGVCGGRRYPKDYEPAQKALLQQSTRATDIPFFDYLTEVRSPLGKACVSGMRYFRAYPDGRVYPCISIKDMPGSIPLGDIRDPGFRLNAAPTSCPASRCVCPREVHNLLQP
ncbi:MAG: radical SAM protein [Elusimicrobia bacterium]|nr:radical SAM protein [Elusimicrobiota bacterium]